MDERSGADHNITVYKPIANNDYFIVGHLAERRYGAAQGASILVKDMSSSQNSFAKPIDFRRIWGDWGSGGAQNWSIWCPVCPNDFVPLGYVAMPGYELPTGPMAVFSGHPFEDVRCVNKQLATPANVHRDKWIYGDWGSGADWDLKVYSIINGQGPHYDAQLFYAQANYNDPTPNPPLNMLKRPAEVVSAATSRPTRLARNVSIDPGLLATVNPVNTAPSNLPNANTPYLLASKAHPGQVIDVEGGRTENGVQILLWDQHGGTGQQFILENTDDGYFQE